MPWPMEVPKGRRIVSDIESNGLLKGMSGGGDIPPMDRIHSATAEDLDTGEHFDWTPDNIREYPEWLMDEVGTVIGHNFLTFDSRAISFIFPTRVNWTEKLILDTLIFCKMVWPADALIGPDMKRWRAGRMPAKYLKRQSLGAWGYRLGNYKGEYDGGWAEWSPEMQDYMVQDGKVNLDLWRLIERRIGWDGNGDTATSSGLQSSESSSGSSSGSYKWPYLPFWIDHEMQQVVTAQEEQGVWFDQERAEALTTELRNSQAEMTADLRRIFPAWWAPKDDPNKGRRITRDRTRVCREHPDITVPRFGKTGNRLKDYVGPPKETRFADSVECRIEWTEFNPNSRTHLADRLQRVFGWEPATFTASGKPQVDEAVIKALPSTVIDEPTRKVIMDYFVVTKTLGMLAEGNKSWMHFYRPEDHRVHGRVDPLGTVTGRGAHFNPNLGQIMSVKVEEVKDEAGKVVSKKPIMGIEGGFGYEARSLFGADQTGDLPEMTGTDMSSLEFIMLGHYLWPYDNGDFSKRACDPSADLHRDHADRSGLSRADAKTLGYLIIYGGGAWKAGLGMGVEEREIADLLMDRGLPNRLRWMKKLQGPDYEEPNDLDKARIVKGAQGIKSIKEAITGLKDLMDGVKEAAGRGYVICIDGRKLHVRKPHAALNTLLQGGGATACKLWIVLFHKKMQARGYRLKADYNQVLWVHDEKQNEHRKGLGGIIAEASEEAAKEAGRMLKLRGEFRTESKTGRNWAETH